MTFYQEFMAKQICDEIKSITDPSILHIYLEVILKQRCHLGGASDGTCIDCKYQNYHCRQLLEITTQERELFFDTNEEEENG